MKKKVLLASLLVSAVFLMLICLKSGDEQTKNKRGEVVELPLGIKNVFFEGKEIDRQISTPTLRHLEYQSIEENAQSFKFFTKFLEKEGTRFQIDPELISIKYCTAEKPISAPAPPPRVKPPKTNVIKPVSFNKGKDFRWTFPYSLVEISFSFDGKIDDTLGSIEVGYVDVNGPHVISGPKHEQPRFNLPCYYFSFTPIDSDKRYVHRIDEKSENSTFFIKLYKDLYDQLFYKGKLDNDRVKLTTTMNDRSDLMFDLIQARQSCSFESNNELERNFVLKKFKDSNYQIEAENYTVINHKDRCDGYAVRLIFQGRILFEYAAEYDRAIEILRNDSVLSSYNDVNSQKLDSK